MPTSVVVTAPSLSTNSNPLAGTYWELLSIGYGDNVTRVSKDVRITVRFTEHGYFGDVGLGGGFGGAYSVDGDVLHLGPATYAWEIPTDDLLVYQQSLAFLYSDNGTFLVSD